VEIVNAKIWSAGVRHPTRSTFLFGPSARRYSTNNLDTPYAGVAARTQRQRRVKYAPQSGFLSGGFKTNGLSQSGMSGRQSLPGNGFKRTG
jgi:hypothetical protein